jgi:hypothetical protein
MILTTTATPFSPSTSIRVKCGSRSFRSAPCLAVGRIAALIHVNGGHQRTIMRYFGLALLRFRKVTAAADVTAQPRRLT